MLTEKPSIIGIILCGMAIAFLIMLLYAIPPEFIYIQFGVIGLAIVFLSTGGVLLWEYISYVRLNIRAELKQQDVTTALSYAVEKISRLNSEQLAMINRAGEGIKIGMVDTSEGLSYYLMTPTDSIPMSFVQDFLSHSGVNELKAIREYSDKTNDRKYAAAFTYWCVAHGYADPAVGNSAARWKTTDTKMEVMRRLELEMEL